MVHAMHETKETVSRRRNGQKLRGSFRVEVELESVESGKQGGESGDETRLAEQPREELARRAINIGSDRVFHTAPDLSDQLSCATVLSPSFSLPWLDSVSSVPLCLSYSPPVPLAEPFLHPDSPTHPTKTTRCKYICARFSHLSTPVSHRPLISFGHTRTRNHPIRSPRLAESIFIQP